MVVELGRRADLLDAALVEHRNTVGDRVRLLLIVGDVDRGDAELALQHFQLGAHLDPQLGVEVGERLVEQQHLGLDHDRPGERDALLLPTGKLRRPAIRVGREPDEFERGAHLAAISARESLRRSRPNATFLATLMCGHSA